MYFNLIDTLARIHAVDVDAVGLESFGKRVENTDQAATKGYIARQIKTWTRQYKATETENIPSMDYLIENLPRMLPTSAEPTSCLVHGDYRVDNVLYKPDSDEVAAVLDWELSTLGDGLADLAYLSLCYHLSPENGFMKGLKGLDITSLGIPSLNEAVDIYCRQLDIYTPGEPHLTANDTRQILDYYLAFSLFRCTAILQGVYKRSLMGNASAANANEALEFAKLSALMGEELLMKYSKSIEKTSVGGAFSATKPLQQASAETIPNRGGVNDLSDIRGIDLFVGTGLLSSRAVDTIRKLKSFINENVMPRENEIAMAGYEGNDRWQPSPVLEELKLKARGEGLWNMFLPKETDNGKFGAGFTNLEYAIMAELTGHSLIAPEVFNCSAPDTGNMEVLARYGSKEQQEAFLNPLLEGKIRSCFAMTEPSVASSDATNMEATVRVDGDDVVLNGTKWWISGAMDPRCKVAIFMGRTHGDLSSVPPHKRHSMVLVPMDAPGIEIIRPMRVMGYDDAPHGHADMKFTDVRVPKSNIILGEGRGFEIAQGRLGPGRIHHCMRIIGAAERALQLMCLRATQRVAFGKSLAEQGTIRTDIANSRVEIDQARLLCLNASHRMDVYGNKIAKDDIAAIKIVAPRMAKAVIDRSMQAHGAMGLSQDTPLAHFWTWARILQLADGPDEVHLTALAKSEIRTQVPEYSSKRR
eukprot:CAMPEP_0185026830 /NCGR_PEP_ID=MMETSP1103-20130426/11335_1 /TAXON_ID=36769 /ORGANISM="Paraphysomonas bandaiensis, Strain Caron Lab Isolate" /LENGTH=698 /DNA_ID=CAMNT_0027560545 /DNA_START=514 /DNA_END=2610 /DNA_ORIENTATION=-